MAPRAQLRLLTRKSFSGAHTSGEIVSPAATPDDLGIGPRDSVGVAWQARGLWCGWFYDATVWSHKSEWFTATDLARPITYCTQRCKRFRYPTDWLRCPFRDVVRRFPRTVLLESIERRRQTRDEPAIDGIPWEIHAINNYAARQAAIKAYLKENSTDADVDARNR